MLESPFKEDIEIHVLELSINTCMFNELIEQMHFERSKGCFGHKFKDFLNLSHVNGSSRHQQYNNFTHNYCLFEFLKLEPRIEGVSVDIT